MADSYEGGDHVRIQVNDLNVPVSMRYPPASASTLNDGAMPYGSTIITAAVNAHQETGTATTALVGTVSLTSNVVTAYLSYSTTLTDGLYHLTSVLQFTLSGSTIVMRREFDFDRVYVGDI